jgi:hypothetical protein
MMADSPEREELRENDTFCECDAIDDPHGRLAQGDVFAWVQAPEDPWRRYGIIITADCDIAHQKNSGVLSYVPLLTVSDYLITFYLPRHASKLRIRIEEDLVKTTHQFQAANLPSYPSLLASDVIISWLEEAGSQAVADDIRASGSEREKFIKYAETRAGLVACASSADIKAHVNAVCGARQFLQGGTLDSVRSKLWKDIQMHLRDLPGDALFIRALTKEHTSGFVAYLRFVRELSQSAVAIKPAELTTGAQARRIGRLRAPYVYRLTQMLGSVFSSIGLPEAYENARHEIVALLQRDEHETGKL